MTLSGDLLRLDKQSGSNARKSESPLIGGLSNDFTPAHFKRMQVTPENATQSPAKHVLYLEARPD
jgi:hypothetical protein